MNRAQRRAANRPGGTMPDQDQAREDFKEKFQQQMLERMTGGGGQQAADPDLLAVLREIRDNTGRIARALEDR